MAATVYFAPRRTQSRDESPVAKTRALLQRVGLAEKIGNGMLTAVKLHFGELGNSTAIRPPYVRTVVEEIKQAGGRPFLVDTNTLYRGQRANAYDHLLTAHRNGFSYGTMGAPVIIGDGLRGQAFVRVPIRKPNVRTAFIAEAIYTADALVVISHLTGHPNAGVGGAVKNLAMGCAAPAGCRQMHQSSKPEVNRDKCTGDAVCIEWCPANAISMVEGKAQIDQQKCIGCGECTVVCPAGAIAIKWDASNDDVQRKMAEYALAAVQNKAGRVVYITYVLDVTPICDCAGWSDLPIVPDVGVLASEDPVAIDQAAVDLVNQQPAMPGSAIDGKCGPGDDKFRALYPRADWSVQLVHAEEVGLGTRAYELVQI